jgi:hypothetical protein
MWDTTPGDVAARMVKANREKAIELARAIIAHIEGEATPAILAPPEAPPLFGLWRCSLANQKP